jgi:hypothetical protein
MERARSRRINPDAVAEIEPPPGEEEVVRPRSRRNQAQSDELDEETGDEEAEGQDSVVVPFARGRKAIKESRPTQDGGNYFKWADNGEVQVVKFLDTEPWSYNQHWVTRSGKQSFPCIGKNCPLCAIGSKVTQKIVYSLLNLSEDNPVVQTLEVTQSVDDILSAFDTDKKTGPLPKMWYALSRTKKPRSSGFGNYNYHVLPIKDRDLEEDYDISLDDAEDALDTAEAPDPVKVLGKVDRKMLQGIADETLA